MGSIAQVTVRFGVDLKEFTTKMQKATRDIQQMGRQMQNTGRSLSRNLTLPLLALGGATTKLAADFDESMTKIETLVGLSKDTVDGFRKSVLDLSGKTAQAPSALADALFTVTSAGLRGAEALEVLEMAAKGSTVGMGETKEIARAVTAVMQAYGPEVISAAKAMDILTATVREGNLEASELAPVLGRVVGLASQMGVSFDEVGASIATFTRLGVDSAEAVTGLRGFLSGIIKPTNEGRDALASLGITFNDLRKSIKDKGLATTMIELVKAFDGNIEALSSVIPNVRALGAVMGTAGAQGDSYLTIQKNIANSAGILNEAFEKTSKSGAAKLKAAFNTLKQIGTEIGNIVLPVVVDLADRVKLLFTNFRNLSDETKKTIVKVAAFAAGVGPAIYVVGTLMTSVGGLIKSLRALSVFLITNPYFALAGAIGAVVIAVTGWNKINKAFGSSSSSMVGEIQNEKNELNSLIGVITDANVTNETRSRVLDKLVENYPNFLGNLKAEKVTNEQLLTKLKDVNAEYEKKIIQQVAEEKTTAMLRERISLQEKEAKLIKDKNKFEEKGVQVGPNESYAVKLIAFNNALERYDQQIIKTRGSQEQLNKEYAEALEFYNSLIPKAQELNSVISGSNAAESTLGGKGLSPIAKISADLTRLKPLIGDIKEDLTGFTNSTLATTEEITGGVGIMEQVFGSLGNTITNVFAGMLTGARSSIGGIIQVITSLIAKLTAAALAALILSALLPGGSNKIGEAGKAASSFGSLFKNFAGFRATGGPVASGSSYIVGEKGPELFSPNSSGHITPNHMITGGGGGGKMQLQVVGSVPIRFMPDGSLTAVLAQEQIRIKKLGG